LRVRFAGFALHAASRTGYSSGSGRGSFACSPLPLPATPVRARFAHWVTVKQLRRG